MADTLARFPPRQPPPGRQEKHEFTVKQRVPAFRADDSVLEELWRIMRDKCAEAGEPRTSLSFSTTTHASGNGPREEHEHKYERIDDLRRAPDKPDRLREYTLHAATSFLDDDGRSIFFNAYRDGACISAKAPDPDWCRDAASAMLTVLRPHTAWYAPIFRLTGLQTFGPVAALTALLLMTAATREQLPGAITLTPIWTTLLVIMLIPLYRELLFSPAEIQIRTPGSNVVTLDRRPRTDVATRKTPKQ